MCFYFELIHSQGVHITTAQTEIAFQNFQKQTQQMITTAVNIQPLSTSVADTSGFALNIVDVRPC
jgi:hypothetical protein